MKITCMNKRVFGWLTVIGTKETRGSNTYWTCRCKCGTIRMFRSEKLHSGRARSCGCANKGEIDRGKIEPIILQHIPVIKNKIKIKRKPKYNNFELKILRTFYGMKRRCYDSNYDGFENYGGRGISICDEWIEDPKKFIEYIGLKPNSSYSVDRINNDGNYEPGNVRWATSREQSLNTRRNVFLEFKGKRQTITEWAEDIGVARYTIAHRLNKLGWTVEEALTIPTIKEKGYSKEDLDLI